jgi:hypothetical protein
VSVFLKSVIMQFTIPDEAKGIYTTVEAVPERFNNEVGYRIFFPNKTNFFICSKYGTWRVLDDHPVNPELLQAIGAAIEEQV